ncbi:MAG: hypothetical protein PPP58_00805 [Natronomonas sp.]
MAEDRTKTKPSRSGEDGSSAASDEFDLGIDDELLDDTGGGTNAPESSTAESDSKGGLRSRAASRATSVFSPRWFLVAAVVFAVGLIGANSLVPLPLSGLLGVGIAAFLLGTLKSEGRYTEMAAAGGAVMGVSALVDFFVVSVLGGFGLPLVAIGAVLGAVVALGGNYFGRDLRDGLTREI